MKKTSLLLILTLIFSTPVIAMDQEEAKGPDNRQEHREHIDTINDLLMLRAIPSLNIDFIQLLITKKAEINTIFIEDGQENTPLMLLLEQPFVCRVYEPYWHASEQEEHTYKIKKIVSMLIQAGADPFIKTSNGKTTFDITDNDDIQQHLIKEASTKPKNEWCCTIL
ncbi:MAG: hypothetical protein NTX86_06075 [Candidatus Dependentiae bacterium]|nr:hypothetical protein [Candidatus Dependentiae bacterium]